MTRFPDGFTETFTRVILPRDLKGNFSEVCAYRKDGEKFFKPSFRCA